MSSDKICDILHIPRGRLSKISLDSEGYMNANYAMVPYILRGDHAGESEQGNDDSSDLFHVFVPPKNRHEVEGHKQVQRASESMSIL